MGVQPRQKMGKPKVMHAHDEDESAVTQVLLERERERERDKCDRKLLCGKIFLLPFHHLLIQHYRWLALPQSPFSHDDSKKDFFGCASTKYESIMEIHFCLCV